MLRLGQHLVGVGQAVAVAVFLGGVVDRPATDAGVFPVVGELAQDVDRLADLPLAGRLTRQVEHHPRRTVVVVLRKRVRVSWSVSSDDVAGREVGHVSEIALEKSAVRIVHVTELFHCQVHLGARDVTHQVEVGIAPDAAGDVGVEAVVALDERRGGTPIGAPAVADPRAR